MATFSVSIKLPSAFKSGSIQLAAADRTLLSTGAFAEQWHGDPGALISVRCKPQGQNLKAVCTIPVGEFGPKTQALQCADMYWSLASQKGGGYSCKRTKLSRGFGLNFPYLQASKRFMAAVPGAWVDVDCNRIGVTPESMYESGIRKLAAIGLKPTHCIFSGGGIWFLFQYATPERDCHSLCERVNRALAQLFNAEMDNGDLSAYDRTRLARVPGSINSKHGRAVRYYQIAGAPRLTLAQIALALNVPAEATAVSLNPERQKNAKKQAAARARWQKPLDTVKDLLSFGRKITAGNRNNLLLALAHLFYRTRRNKAEAYKYLAEVNRHNITPPLENGRIIAAISGGYRPATQGSFRKSLSNRHIARVLGMDRAEAVLYGLIKPERQSCKQKIAVRHSQIKAMIQAEGYIPQATLALRFHVSLRTIASDLKALGIVNTDSSRTKHLRVNEQRSVQVIDQHAISSASHKSNGSNEPYSNLLCTSIRNCTSLSSAGKTLPQQQEKAPLGRTGKAEKVGPHDYGRHDPEVSQDSSIKHGEYLPEFPNIRIDLSGFLVTAKDAEAGAGLVSSKSVLLGAVPRSAEAMELEAVGA